MSKKSGQEQNLWSFSLCIFSSLYFSTLLFLLLSYGYYSLIQSVPGGMCQTLGECSLC